MAAGAHTQHFARISDNQICKHLVDLEIFFTGNSRKPLFRGLERVLNSSFRQLADRHDGKETN